MNTTQNLNLMYCLNTLKTLILLLTVTIRFTTRFWTHLYCRKRLQILNKILNYILIVTNKERTCTVANAHASDGCARPSNRSAPGSSTPQPSVPSTASANSSASGMRASSIAGDFYCRIYSIYYLE
ncbi:hypothetical protein T492DRAFT_510181 [Pavlovales sp. CCMP2436]|nr:hypothetical protein T492DRAFT_510181 [Pavlovales sp. CCMP2436]